MSQAEKPTYYVRVTDFDYENEFSDVGPPRLVGKPMSAVNHVEAYWHILHQTKEAAIKSFFDEISAFSEGSPDHVRSFVLNHWPAEETVCKAEIEDDGGVCCFKRVAKLSSEGVQAIDLDEDFHLWIGREEIFERAEVRDDHAPPVRRP